MEPKKSKRLNISEHFSYPGHFRTSKTKKIKRITKIRYFTSFGTKFQIFTKFVLKKAYRIIILMGFNFTLCSINSEKKKNNKKNIYVLDSSKI